MKNLSVLILVAVLMLFCLNVDAKSFSEAIAQSDRKPMVVFIYADWSGYGNLLKNFRAVKPKFKDKINFVELDIASNEMQAFNSRYYLYSNLPYAMFISGGGKSTRVIRQDCLSSKSCLSTKIETFIR